MSRTHEDIEDEIEEAKERLSELESAYEEEGEEDKAQKLEYKIDRQDGKIRSLMTRLEAVGEEEESAEEEEDEDCCPNCGSELFEVGTDAETGNRVFECVKCHGWYEEN